MAIIPLGVGAHLERWGYPESKLIEEEWGTEVAPENNKKLSLLLPDIFSGRRVRQNDTLWSSYVLITPTKEFS